MSTSDPTAPNELVEHARFVRRVAGSLVRDEDDADDAAQDAMMAALDRPPKHVTSARGWLATVVRNVVRKRARSDTRRGAREQRTATGGPAPSAEDQAARAEMVQSVTTALMQLVPAQRAVVMMRFYEGLPPREIASRLDISVNTVKSRLRLALGHMRSTLGDDVGPEWRTAAIGAFGLEHWFTPVVPIGTGTAATQTLAAATAAGGGFVMNGAWKVTAAVAAAALVVSGAALWISGRQAENSDALTDTELLTGDSPPAHRSPELLGTARAMMDGEATSGGDEASSASTPATVATPPTKDSGAAESALPKTAPTTLEGQILFEGQPLTRGTGLLWRNNGWMTAGAIPAGRPPAREIELTRDGTFRFDELEDGKWMLGVRLDDGIQRLYYKSRLTGKERNVREVIELGTSEVFGTVYDADGSPAVGAAVRVSRSNSSGSFIAQLVTDNAGHYRVGKLVGGGTWVSMALDGDMNKSDDKHVSVPDGGRLEVSFGSSIGRFWVAGQVQCTDGTVVRGPGRIVLGPVEKTFGMVIIPYDKDGRFKHHLEPKTYALHVWRPNGGRPGLTGSKMPTFDVAHEDLDKVWVLPGTRITGTIVAEAPVRAGIRISLKAVTPELAKDTFNRRIGASTDAEGRYTLWGVMPGVYRLYAWHGTLGKSRTIEIEVPAGRDQMHYKLTLIPTATK